MRRAVSIVCAAMIALALLSGAGIIVSAAPTVLSGKVLFDSDLLFLPAGDDITTLDSQMVQETYAGYGSWGWALLDIDWKYSDFDSSVTGMQMLKGQLLLTEDYTYATPSDLVVEQPVWVHKEGMTETLPVVMDALFINNAYAFAVGTPIDDIAQMLGIAGGKEVRLVWLRNASQRYGFFETAVLDPEAIDTDAIGAYTPWSVPLAHGLVLADNVPVIGIMEADAIDLSMGAISLAQTKIFFKWLFEAPDYEIWMLKDIDPDEAEEEDWYKHNGAGIDYYESTGMYLKYAYWELGTYYIQARYEGGESNILCLIVAENEFARAFPIGGDRDGGDSGGHDPDDLEQEPPGMPDPGDGEQKPPNLPGPGDGETDDNITDGEDQTDGNNNAPAGGEWVTVGGAAQGAAAAAVTSSTPDPAPRPSDDGAIEPEIHDEPDEPVREKQTATQTVVTGLRLREMIAAQPGGVLFHKQPLSLWLDTAWLEGLALGDYDTLAVTLSMQGAAFTVDVAVNGVPVAELPPTLLRITYDANAQQLVCVGDDGRTIEVSYDAALGVAELMIDRCGSFRLQSADDEEQKRVEFDPQLRDGDGDQTGGRGIMSNPLLYIGGLGATGAAAGAGWLVRVRRRHSS